MFTATDGRCWSLGRGAAVLVAALTTWMIAALPASAQAPPSGALFVHSAKSGQLGGGRLMLEGVTGRVSWAHDSGRAGTLAVRRMHRQLFSAGKPAATGTLHVAGHRGGDELTLRLSKPRYNATRRMVSYAVRRITGRLPGRAAGAAGVARRFGAASLSIVGSQATDGPALQLDADVYGCPSDPAGLKCFGTVSGSGLAGGSVVNSFIQGVSQPINEFEVDRDGNLGPTRLAMVCGNVGAISVTGQAPDGSAVKANAGAPC